MIARIIPFVNIAPKIQLAFLRILIYFIHGFTKRRYKQLVARQSDAEGAKLIALLALATNHLS